MNLLMELLCVCVFFTLNRSSTRRHPAHPVSVLILQSRKISSVVTSHDTEIMHRNAFDNAMSCPSTGYDRHNIHTSATEIHWKKVCVDDLSNCCCVLCGWVAIISILFVKNTHPPTNKPGWANRACHEQALRIHNGFGRGHR